MMYTENFIREFVRLSGVNSSKVKAIVDDEYNRMNEVSDGDVIDEFISTIKDVDLLYNKVRTAHFGPLKLPTEALVVCDYFNVVPEKLNKKTRKIAIVNCRKFICKILSERKIDPYSESAIGVIIGTTHSNVNHHKRTLNELLETDKEYIGYYNSIMKLIKNS